MAKWKPSYTFDDEIRKDPKMIRMLVNVAEGVAAKAKLLAPVGPARDDGREHYRDSIEVNVRTGRSGRKRVSVRTNALGHLIETGSVQRLTDKLEDRGWMPAKKVLRRAARASGLKFRGTRKKKS